MKEMKRGNLDDVGRILEGHRTKNLRLVAAQITETALTPLKCRGSTRLAFLAAGRDRFLGGFHVVRAILVLMLEKSRRFSRRPPRTPNSSAIS